jgi:ankyrin repeat protein
VITYHLLLLFLDGLVSHVCTINTADGSTVFHRCVRKGDSYRIMELLLKIDDTCINIQNSSGLTPLHLACQLDRRHCVDKLLVSDVIFYVMFVKYRKKNNRKMLLIKRKTKNTILLKQFQNLIEKS